jgi:hypothetical protein
MIEQTFSLHSDAEYRKWYDHGLADKKIAKRMRVATANVAAWREKNNLPRHMTRPSIIYVDAFE